MKVNFESNLIAIVGLGYVGLPLAVEFGKLRDVVGFDINKKRINELKDNIDSTNEVTPSDIAKAKMLRFTDDVEKLSDASIYIVTVPTPIDSNNRPDLTLLLKASETIGDYLRPGDTVIYESTVYPGATEEDCVPILEKFSGLKFNKDFFCGYSPERINPGDKTHGISDVCKVTSGSTPEVANAIDNLYATIISAGTHKAPSIKVAEAAKVIENTQRDLNIALVNELAIIFNLMDIDSEDVLKAAETKWNFMPFRPGLVGGHCIGVDPYYLTHKAETFGYDPKVILSGRRINDNMSKYVATQMINEMLKRDINLDDSKILVLGFSFKENCPDIRNTRVVELVSELENYVAKVDVHDPIVNINDARDEYDLDLIKSPGKEEYDGIILAVCHDVFKSNGIDSIRSFGKPGHIFYDLKSMFNKSNSELRL